MRIPIMATQIERIAILGDPKKAGQMARSEA
jgi:hypothetical protein